MKIISKTPPIRIYLDGEEAENIAVGLSYMYSYLANDTGFHVGAEEDGKSVELSYAENFILEFCSVMPNDIKVVRKFNIDLLEKAKNKLEYSNEHN